MDALVKLAIGACTLALIIALVQLGIDRKSGVPLVAFTVICMGVLWAAFGYMS